MKTAIRIQPIVKWSGSKRLIACQIGRLFPESDIYFEPFVGGGALLPYRTSANAIVGDICEELVGIWKTLQLDPQTVAYEYKKRWLALQKHGHEYYYSVRNSFNSERNPMDLLFLTRTCVNGLIRFNSKGEFNNSLHHTRKGIQPERFAVLAFQWSKIVKNVSFKAGDYRDTTSNAKKGDLIFFDPPYACNKGRYQTERFNMQEFFEYLDRLNKKGVHWVLTLDGHASTRIYDSGIPNELYKKALALHTGNSPFTKLMRQSLDKVIESVYLNFNPSGQRSLVFA